MLAGHGPGMGGGVVRGPYTSGHQQQVVGPGIPRHLWREETRWKCGKMLLLKKNKGTNKNQTLGII